MKVPKKCFFVHNRQPCHPQNGFEIIFDIDAFFACLNVIYSEGFTLSPSSCAHPSEAVKPLAWVSQMAKP